MESVTKPRNSKQSTKPSDDSEADQLSNQLCDLCIQDKDQVTASVYCNDCREYLCTSCHRVHQRGAATKQHKVKEGKYMPRVSSKGRTDADRAVGTDKSAEPGSSSNKRAVYLEQLIVGSAADEYYAAVNAIEVLPDGSVLVCDYGNYKMKLFDAENELRYEVKLSSEPYGMALLENYEAMPDASDNIDAIVTLPKESSLQKVRVKSRKVKHGSKLSLEGKPSTKLRCEKIIRYQNNFIVSAHDDMYFCLSVIDSAGKILHSIYDEPKASLDVFKSYYEMALSQDEKTIYITNQKHGCVALSLDGNIIFKYKEKGEGNHYGIATDPDGFVFIACCDNDKVIVINKAGKKVNDIIALKGLKPSFVGYQRTASKIYIGQANTNKVLCYQIKG